MPKLLERRILTITQAVCPNMEMITLEKVLWTLGMGLN
ncbi:MAG: quinolinate synthase NadA [bacterium]|nr:quinolinate synthase NadA [bacterium]